MRRPEARSCLTRARRTSFRSPTDKQGNLYAGTDSNGIVMRFGADGKPFGLLDSPLREIHELAVGPDGSVYVLALRRIGIGGKTGRGAPRPRRRKQNRFGR